MLPIDKNSFCATHTLTVRDPGYDLRWTDAEIKDANAKDKEVVDVCYTATQVQK